MTYQTSLQLFIDGVWKSGEGREAHPVVNPVNAQPIADLPYATKADLDEALAASDRAWPEWRAMDVEKRGAILHKAAALVRERADHIAATLTQEQGKILAEAKAEVLASAQLFDWYAEDAKRDYGRT
ncbi:MAG: aldehyde dehydrogenase family protein, partial [Sphingomicrobium sp.]